MEVYPERQKRQKTRFVCNFNGKSVFRCTQRAITQRRVITLGPIFIKMVLNRAQGLKKKSQEVSARKNNNRQRYNKKCRRGGRIPPPPGSFRVKDLLWQSRENYWPRFGYIKCFWVLNPPETFSVARPPNGGFCNPFYGFSILNSLYPYVCYQCIAMGLLFPLIQKSIIRLRITSLWPHTASAPSKFWKYSQSLTNIHKE